MAVLRSRSLDNNPCVIANPGVARSLDAWQQRIDAAHAAGRREAEAEMKARAQDLAKREQALEERCQQAREQAAAEAEERLGTAIKAVAAAAEQMATLHHEAVRAAERDIIEMALALAGCVLQQRIDTDPHWLEPVVAHFLSLVPDRHQVSLRLHSQDAEQLRQVIGSLGASAGIDDIEIIAADGVQRGPLTATSGGTTIDAGAPGTWSRLGEIWRQAAPPATAHINTGSDTGRKDAP